MFGNYQPYKTSIDIPPSVEWVLLGFPVVFILSCIVLRLASPDVYLQFVTEDGPVQTATAIVYFLAFIATILILRNLQYQQLRTYTLLYGGLALCFLFVALEEISWGQRYIGFDSPQYFAAHNLQEETTLHNLVHGQYIHILYAFVGFYGVFARFLVPSSIRDRLGADLDYFIPGRSLTVFFLVPLVYFSIPLSIIWTKPLHGYLTWREQEPTEFLLSMGFLCFVSLVLYRQYTLFGKIWASGGRQRQAGSVPQRDVKPGS